MKNNTKINTVIYKFKSLYIKCDCSTHMLQAERYYEDKVDKGFNFAIWYYGIRGTLTLKERLRWCWKLLTTGNIWADSVIITDEKALELADFIKTELKNENTNE